jgi:hypothetical protein
MILSASHAFLKIRFIALLLLGISFFWSTTLPSANIAYSTLPSEVGLAVTVVPSSVVIRVGEKVSINVTVTSGEAPPIGRVCFSAQGFPESGFRVSFLPECVTSQSNRIAAILTVEVTAAAAPQKFTAFIIAQSEAENAQTSLDVTVEPAFPPWITWAGLLLFLLILGGAIIGKPKLRIQGVRHLLGRRSALGTMLVPGTLGTCQQERTGPPASPTESIQRKECQPTESSQVALAPRGSAWRKHDDSTATARTCQNPWCQTA